MIKTEMKATPKIQEKMISPLTLPPSDTIPQRGNRSFGRRLGRPLKQKRRQTIEKLDILGIQADFLTQDATKDPRDLFPKGMTAPKKIWMEIGFGSGEHLLARLSQNPSYAYIGAEPYMNGMTALLGALPPSLPENLRLFMDDALIILRSMQDKSLDGLYILNPDPWPKARHHKRRIINMQNLDLFARVLKPNSLLVLSTDVPELAHWIMDHINASEHFDLQQKTIEESYIKPADWPLITRYMSKGITQGRPAHYLTAIRKNI